MPSHKHTSLDRVLGRIDTLDPVNLANLAQRLARERRLFEDIFDTLQEGVLLVDADGHIDYANQTAVRILGLRDENIADTILWRLVPGLRPTLETETPIVTREIELTYPELRTLRLYMVGLRQEVTSDPGSAGVTPADEGRPDPRHDHGRSARRAPSAGGTPALPVRRFAVILTDITCDRAATEARIEDERLESLRHLAAGVAHELGNPLNSLTIHLQLIERRLKKPKPSVDTPAALADSIAICQQEVQRLDGIISNFLEALRPRPPDLAEANLSDILADVLDFQKHELENRRIAVEAEIPDALPAIMADRDQLKQVFFNLIKNAVESMHDGGELRIKARGDDEHVYLLFGDTGAGIKQDDLVKLFQPYHTTKPGGHGLGLMIVQRIMRAHGGQIGIESKENVGTVVTLQFPRKDRRIRMLK